MLSDLCPPCVSLQPHTVRTGVVCVCYVQEHERLWGLGVRFQEQVIGEGVQEQVSGEVVQDLVSGARVQEHLSGAGVQGQGAQMKGALEQ